jgi:RHS repeat-associated protein
MNKHIKYLVLFFIGAGTQAAAQNIPVTGSNPAATTVKPLPAAYTSTPVNYLRNYAPQVPIQDTSVINMTATVENVLTAITFTDSYGRTVETVAKQLSPGKKDNVAAPWYDEFGRSGAYSYLPFAAVTGNVNDGGFKTNPFQQDSLFYKTIFADEQVNYQQMQYDGSPLNIPVKAMAQGNEWGGTGKGQVFAHRSNITADSVRYWTIGIVNEDDIPATAALYPAGSLSVQEVTDEKGVKTVSYIDILGRTILTKKQLAAAPTTGHSGWLCTYYVYDEMSHLRLVLPPKAVEALNNATANWNLTTNATINTNLCYGYYYDSRGRTIMKRIPGKGKFYTAYDLLDRVVMTQDPNLRTTGRWAFVLYEGQFRPAKSGVITTALIKDTVINQAARSTSYPTLTGTFTVTTEAYYDDYSWIAPTAAPVSASLSATNINSTNFNTAYNTAPDYAQPLTASNRIRGSLTGTKKIILNSSTYLYSVNFYDNWGRSLQTAQTNYTGGTDVATVQTDFSGRVLRTHLAHQKSGTNAQNHTVLTKYTYDHAGRLKNLVKNFDNLGDKTITQNTYNELGQVQSKIIGTNTETQNYTYNIRGWLLGINSGYVNNTSTSYFGETISYNYGFTTNQVNGSIAGVKWKAAGDQIARAYGFSYDNANRLTTADFSQQNTTAAAWTKDKADYTVSGLGYDANGNILKMKQRGLQVGASATIDSLAYTYFTNSNQLQKVADGITDPSPMGDFKDTALVADDYTYDANGNINKDYNRRMHTAANGPGAVFNILDKADSISIKGKSGTYYYYDATGNMLRKQVNNYSGTGQAVKNFLYIGGFVYMNDTLQYVLNEEGRIRYTQKRNSTTGVLYYAYEYDYFIKDHLGNVRTVLTEGRDTASYQATMEPAAQVTENALFSNEYTPVNTILAKPAGFDAVTANTQVSRLNGNTAINKKTGPGLVLKVMAGDQVQINTYAFYNTATQAPLGGVTLLPDLLSALTGGIISNSGGKLGSNNSTALNTTLSPTVNSFLSTGRSYDNTRPKAYLNWILFDNQFNLVATNTGVAQVIAGASKQALVAPLQNISKNGYLYVYVSNESPQDVYFDDITVKHYTGALVQEQAFYPFGLQMSNISDKAALKANNPYRFNAGSELEEDGVNYYNTFYRKYDAQIGRFTGVDMLSEVGFSQSPYHFGENNPITFNDPTGALKAVNPASFNNAGDLLKYIQENGISGFDYEFISWSFSFSGTAGPSPLSSLTYSNDVSVGTKNGQRGLWINFAASKANGQYGGFGKISTFDEIIVGRTFIGAQALWSSALQYGENHRDASINWFNGAQHYDVMWQHNYDAYISRRSRGDEAPKINDRASYIDGFASFGSYYKAQQEGRKFEAGFVSIFAAPLVLFGAAEIGVGALISEVPLVYTEASIRVYSIIGNLTVEARLALSILGGMGANASLKLNEQQLFNAMSAASQVSPYNNTEVIKQIIRTIVPLRRYFE